MDKITACQDFLKSLRVAINNTSIYFKDHPVFIKSVEDLIEKIYALLSITSLLRIDITANNIICAGEEITGSKIYEQLVEILHTRKVKSIEIKEGVGANELVSFLVNIRLSSRDILSKGGLANILRTYNVAHIVIGDLDYSQLLEGEEGEEYKDIWFYLLKTSLDKGDAKTIDDLAGKFQKLLKKVNLKDLSDDKQVKDNISKFLKHLKSTDRDKFSQCSGDIMKTILENAGLAGDIDLGKLRVFLKDLGGEQLSKILLYEIQKSEKVDTLSLNLFSKLVDREKHKEIASSLVKEISLDENIKNKSRVVEGIKALISLPGDSYIPQIYSSRLSSILKDTKLGEGMLFDRDMLQANYRLTLLDLFSLEFNQERLESIWKSTVGEIDIALKENRTEYIMNFVKVLKDKHQQYPDLEDFLAKIDEYIGGFLENAVLSNQIDMEPQKIISIIGRSSLGANFYIYTVFESNNIKSAILKMFFKFFPSEMEMFCENLEKKIDDGPFIKNMLENIEGLDRTTSKTILKLIYNKSNKFVRAEVLKKMEALGLCDENFVFSVLEKGDHGERKQALLILSKNSQLAIKAAKKLLSITNPFGIRSKIINSNLELINEVILPEAKPHLEALTKYKFFWNRSIRQKAGQTLRKLQ